MSAPAISVGITTRNRPDALRRCLESLRCLAHLSPEVLVFDDASAPAVEEQLTAELNDLGVRILRDAEGGGYIAGRNRLVRAAAAEFVLLLDDDAALLDAAGVEAGIAIMARDSRVAAIAYAQADRHGAPWPEPMQPARCTAPSVVPSFIGFAHMLRRATFLELGGYRERFVFYGEEKDYCLRLIDAGHTTVYLPGARVMHDPDASGRSQTRYLRFVTRNDCLNALYNEPIGRLLWLLPARLFLYFRMRRQWGIRDAFGWLWILNEVRVNFLPVVRERRPVAASTLRSWATLKNQPTIYLTLIASVLPWP